VLVAAHRRREQTAVDAVALNAYLTAAWSKKKRLRPFKLEWQHKAAAHAVTREEGQEQRRMREAIVAAGPGRYRSPSADDAARIIAARQAKRKVS
jgi:hypothetical protein